MSILLFKPNISLPATETAAHRAIARSGSHLGAKIIFAIYMYVVCNLHLYVSLKFKLLIHL